MNLLDKFQGKNPIPFVCEVSYSDDSKGELKFFARDMRHALEVANYWMVEKATILEVRIYAVQVKGKHIKEEDTSQIMGG